MAIRSPLLMSRSRCLLKWAIDNLRLSDHKCRRAASTSATVFGVPQQQKRVLITGAMGQLGPGLGHFLRGELGTNNVIMSDIVQPPEHIKHDGPYVFCDVLNRHQLSQMIVDYRINCLVHFGALLSAVAEENLERAFKVNVLGSQNVLDAARRFGCQLFIPSTIGAFGPTSPLDFTPDICSQRPRTVYGVSKVFVELMGEYYHTRFGVDFRSLRFPGIVSADTEAGGGTTDYAMQAFRAAMCDPASLYRCYLEPDAQLPMMYKDDCLRSVFELLMAPEQALTQRTYNVAAFSMTPLQLCEQIVKFVPHFQMQFDVDAKRQTIANDWPRQLDDTKARHDWNWRHHFDFGRMCARMFSELGHGDFEQVERESVV